jgi:hypothetical protein
MKYSDLPKIIRPAGLVVVLLSYITVCILSLFVLPLDRESIFETVIDSLLTLTITWSSLYIASRGVEKSISISRNSNQS